VQQRVVAGAAVAWYTFHMSTISLLDRFLEPVVEFLPADTAQKIVDLRIAPDLQARLDELAEKANRGSLTEDEREEYEGYVEELDVIAIIKLKARAALRRQGT
jgi:predicted DNA-binding protein